MKKSEVADAFQMTKEHRELMDLWPTWLLGARSSSELTQIDPMEEGGDLIIPANGDIVREDYWIVLNNSGEMNSYTPKEYELFQAAEWMRKLLAEEEETRLLLSKVQTKLLSKKNKRMKKLEKLVEEAYFKAYRAGDHTGTGDVLSSWEDSDAKKTIDDMTRNYWNDSEPVVEPLRKAAEYQPIEKYTCYTCHSCGGEWYGISPCTECWEGGA